MAKQKKIYIRLGWTEDGTLDWFGSFATLKEAEEDADVGHDIYEVTNKWEVKNKTTLSKERNITDELS